MQVLLRLFIYSPIGLLNRLLGFVQMIGMFKNQLQELAQRSCFNLPSYSCTREGPDHAPRFKATVNFNGETFESPTFCPTLRLAEHAAAEVALNTLANRGPSKTLAARVLDETGIYKNLLQETAHRAGLKLPVYTTIRSGPGHAPVFSCTIELAGMSFSGESSRTKKQAQKNAAIAAWTALKQLAQSRSSSSTSTSSSSPQVDGSDEQDQVIIARVLASLQLSEPNKSPSQFDQQRSICPDSFLNSPPLPPLYSVQHERWAYSNFPADIAMYQLWHHQSHLLPLQTRIFPLPISLNPPNPQVGLPMRSVFQEHVPIRPGSTVPTLSATSYLPRGLVLSPIRGSSMVRIQEIEEKTDGSSNIRTGETGAIVQEQAQDRRNQISLGSNRLNLMGPQRPLMPSSHMIGRPTSAETLVPRLGLLVGPRNQNLGNRSPAPLQMRTGAADANLAEQGTGFGRVPSRFMVPAVQIRTVTPVCSAPPVTVRKMQNTSQVGQSLNQEAKGIGRDDGDVSEASSGIGKLRI